MAEAIADDGSPLADYLRQSHEPLDSTASSSASLSSGSSSSAASPRLPRAPSPASPRTRTRYRPPSRSSEAATERLKYALATSALLSARLADALQLYPPLESLEASVTSSAKNDKGKRRAGEHEKESDSGVSWPEDWESTGQGWQDRGVVGNAEVALGGLMSALKRLSRSGTSISVSTVGPKRKTGTGRAGLEGKAIERVEEFVAAAQELDLRVAAALAAVKELECIAHGLGLSDPLPPISRIEARSYTTHLSTSRLQPSASTSQPSPSTPIRIPSPLNPSPPRFGVEHATSPPPLRALALRRALASALSAAFDALSTATNSLDSLLPINSPLRTSSSLMSRPPAHAPRASLSELLRHSQAAALERAEISSFNDGASTSSVSHSRPGSVVFPDGTAVDPFHPTESTFGGIERRQPQHYRTVSSCSSSYLAAPGLSRQPSLPTLLPGGNHRVRPSLGAVGSFGLGTAASTPVKAGGRKKRPASLGGWGGQTTVFRLKSDAGSVPSSPSLSAQEVEEEVEEEEEEEVEAENGGLQRDEEREDLAPFLLVSLQESFEAAHDARRAALWRMLEALENPDVEVGEDVLWKKVEEVFVILTKGLVECAGQVKAANEVEFGDGTTTPAAGRGLSEGSQREEQEIVKAREREKKRRSGLFYGGIDDHLIPSSPASNSAPPLTPITQQRAAGVQHALSRLTGAAASPAPASPTPARRLPHPPPPASYANFAPSSRPSLPATSAALEAQQHLTALTLPLRAIQAKLRLVSADMPAASASSSPTSPEIERLLSTYDSILPELERLTSCFHAGRSALRVSLRVDDPPARPASVASSSSANGNTHGVEPLLEEDEVPPPEQGDSAEGAVYTSLDEDASAVVEAEERQALLDAALSMALLPPTPNGASGAVAGEEKVFEAVAGPEKVRGAGGEKLSREERIRRMKEARDALALGRSAVGVEGQGESEGGGVQHQAKMVGELREVLRELNRERGRAGK